MSTRRLSLVSAVAVSLCALGAPSAQVDDPPSESDDTDAEKKADEKSDPDTSDPQPTDPGPPEPESVDAEPSTKPEAARPAATANAEIERSNDKHAGAVTETSRPRSGAHVVWAALMLPERLVEAVFLPVGALVVVAERHNVPKRMSDLLENDAGTIKVSPKLKVSTGQGAGAGASITFKSLLASQARLRLAGTYELDQDYELDLRYSRRIASANGRELMLQLNYEAEKGNNYFGIGDNTSSENRELGINSLIANLSLDLNDRGAQRFYGNFELGYQRQELFAGSGNDPPVGEPGDVVEPPPGFGETADFASIGFSGRIDSRDTAARTSRGTLLELAGRFVLDLNDNQRNAVTARAAAVLYIPVYGRRRTLAFSAGLGLAQAVTEGGEVPFPAFLVMGRNNFLRGYDKERFRATRGWWTSAEYRYPIWYLNKYPVVLTSRLFFDLGREGDEFGDLIEGPLRYSYGAGLTLERYKNAFSGIQLGFSPEGEQIVFTAGALL